MHTQDLVLDAGRKWNWDRIGIGLSSICVAHCLLTPLAFALLPAIGAAFGEAAHEFHWIMMVLLLPVALFAFVRGFRHHGEYSVVILGFVGVAIITVALFIPEPWFGVYGHTYVNIAGSLCLISGHVLNRRFCARCEHAH